MNCPFALQHLADPYAQRRDWVRPSWIDAFMSWMWQVTPGRRVALFVRREVFVWRVKRAASCMAAMDAPQLQQELLDVRLALRRDGFSDGRNARAFALVQQLCLHTLGVAHFDSQLRGAWIMLGGRIAEMDTGEGKTLAATLAAATAGLAGLPVHVITVNDYLAQRDFEKLSPLYAALGLSIGLVIEETEQPKRLSEYRKDIVYCSNKTIVFDYLRDRSKLGARMKPMPMALDIVLDGLRDQGRCPALRGLHFAIVDEADSVFVDEARTPLILSATVGDAQAQAYWAQAVDVAASLQIPEHVRIFYDHSRAELTESGRLHVREITRNLEPIWHVELRTYETIQQALGALHLFKRDVHYIVRDGKVMIVDANTGRVMADRSWERGLHQMIEMKEGVEVTGDRETLARISYQLFFRRYVLLSGMTGTCREVAGEMNVVYGLDTLRVPTRLPSRRLRLPTQMYGTAVDKWNAVARSIELRIRKGQAVLVGTRSILASEQLGRHLQNLGVEHRVLNAKQNKDEAEVIERAGEWGAVTLATSMAGRGTDIALSPEVAHAGGLHVILTERHDNGRVDRQLVGRCARQGDPGSRESILSMDDEIVRERWPRLVGFVRQWLILAPNSLLPRWLGLACHNIAQHQLEQEHRRVRRALLSSDFDVRSALSFSGQME